MKTRTPAPRRRRTSAPRQEAQGGIEPPSVPPAQRETSHASQQVANAIELQQRCRATRTPAPLMIMSVEGAVAPTRLDRWAAMETWTPREASLLVCGFDPGTLAESTLGQEVPSVTGLCGGRFAGVRVFEEALRIEDLWNRRVHAVDRVRPREFVTWCEAAGIDARWLRALRGTSNEPLPRLSVEASSVAGLSTEAPLATLAAGAAAFAPETPEQRDARLLAWLIEEQQLKPHGAQARVAERAGLARQTVSQYIERARKRQTESKGPIGVMSRDLTK